MKCDKCNKQVNPATGLYCTGTEYGSICKDCEDKIQVSSLCKRCDNCGIWIDSIQYPLCSKCRKFAGYNFNKMCKRLFFRFLQGTVWNLKDFLNSNFCKDFNNHYISYVIEDFIWDYLLSYLEEHKYYFYKNIEMLTDIHIKDDKIEFLVKHELKTCYSKFTESKGSIYFSELFIYIKKKTQLNKLSDLDLLSKRIEQKPELIQRSLF